jgi:hypothetical protein
MTRASLIAVFRHLLFVRESAPNDGFWVNFIQRFTGNRVGDSWCASVVSLVLDIAYRGKSPIGKSAACQVLLDRARAKGFVVSGEPQPEDLFFYVNAAGRAHHVGIVTSVHPLVGIAGNTSPDGASSNGTGVFEHAISARVFVRLPKEIEA